MFRERSAALDVLRSSLDAASVRAEQICSNSQLTWDENVRIEVLHPPPEGVIGSDNANSIVLAVEYEGVRLLLTGDLETTGLDRVVARQPLSCDIVMAPHHGSPHSDPKVFARWTTPRWTVVSRGHGHEFAEVSAAYGNVGSRVLDTAQYGAIRATVPRWRRRRAQLAPRRLEVVRSSARSPRRRALLVPETPAQPANSRRFDRLFSRFGWPPPNTTFRPIWTKRAKSVGLRLPISCRMVH